MLTVQPAVPSLFRVQHAPVGGGAQTASAQLLDPKPMLCLPVGHAVHELAQGTSK